LRFGRGGGMWISSAAPASWVRGVCQPRPLRMRRPLARRRSAAANGGARTAVPLDLGKELLRVAAYLHGSLGANVLCAHAGVDGQRRALSVLGANALSRRSGERCAGRTLYAAPGAPVQLQRIQEPRVLVVAPALALLADDVRLARLRGRGGQLTLCAPLRASEARWRGYAGSGAAARWSHTASEPVRKFGSTDTAGANTSAAPGGHTQTSATINSDHCPAAHTPHRKMYSLKKQCCCYFIRAERVESGSQLTILPVRHTRQLPVQRACRQRRPQQPQGMHAVLICAHTPDSGKLRRTQHSAQQCAPS